VNVWEVGTDVEPFVLDVEPFITKELDTKVLFSPDGKYFVTHSGEAVRVWDAAVLNRTATTKANAPPKPK
jgi:hypothetical protein